MAELSLEEMAALAESIPLEKYERNTRAFVLYDRFILINTFHASINQHTFIPADSLRNILQKAKAYFEPKLNIILEERAITLHDLLTGECKAERNDVEYYIDIFVKEKCRPEDFVEGENMQTYVPGGKYDSDKPKETLLACLFERFNADKGVIHHKEQTAMTPYIKNFLAHKEMAPYSLRYLIHKSQQVKE
jgi:hypothetical protein